MKNYKCPYCDHTITTTFDDKLKEKQELYWAGFLNCIKCDKEYRLILVKGAYIKPVRLNKNGYDKLVQANKVAEESFQNGTPLAATPKKFKTWVNCVSDENLNQYFNSKRVIEYKVNTPADAKDEAMSDAAIKIFKHQPKLKSVQLMCYYVTLARTATLEIQTIYNKHTNLIIERQGVPEWRSEESSPITWDEDEFCIDVIASETPFPYDHDVIRPYED